MLLERKPEQIDKIACGCFLLFEEKYVYFHRIKDDKWNSITTEVLEGETPKEAIKKELRENIGLNLEPEYFKTTYHKYGKENIEYHMFFCKFLEDPTEKIILNEENKKYKEFKLIEFSETVNLNLYDDEYEVLTLFLQR